MKSFIVFSALCAIAIAGPFEASYVKLEEDTDGYYKLAYDTQLTGRQETREHGGATQGSYSYTDPEGHKHIVTYVAAPNAGFIANSADIPLPVPETPEIINARNEHLSVLARTAPALEEPKVPVSAVLARLAVPEIARLPFPAVPAEDQSLESERAQLLAAYAEALARLAEEYKRA